jgi:uncharacterized protein YjbI with pentapeptide repeats
VISFGKIILTAILTVTTTLSSWGMESPIPEDIYFKIIKMMINDPDNPQGEELVGIANFSMSCKSINEVSNLFWRNQVEENLSGIKDQKPQDMNWLEFFVVNMNTNFVNKNKTFKEGHRANKWLRCANFCEAPLDTVHLSQTILCKANFSGVSLTRRKFQKTFSYEPNFLGANLSGAVFTRAYLNSANFANANLAGADLTSARLDFINFSGANLFGANFTGADLNKVNFTKANLNQAKFCNAGIYFTILERADLEDADFERACIKILKIKHANFTGANIKLARLLGDEHNHKPITLAWLLQQGAFWDKNNPPIFE